MSITDELRGWYSERVFMANGWHELDAIADRIDAEHEQLMAEQFESLTFDMKPMTDEKMAEHGWIRLPEADDGMPIRVGDVLQHHPQGLKFKVKELIFNGDDWFVSFGEKPSVFNITAYSHYQPDTWERIIEDAVRLGFTDPDNESLALKLVARCKTLSKEDE